MTLANTVFAPALVRLNVSAGAVEEFATEVVNSGDKLPAVNVVTVPVKHAATLHVPLAIDGQPVDADVFSPVPPLIG